MPSKRGGVRKSPRGASPLATPPRKLASPKSPASGLGSSRKRKKSPGRLSSRKKVNKRLDKSFSRDDVDPDDQEDDAPATGDPDGEEPQDDPGYAPEDPLSLLDQLEASDNPLMKLVAQEFRARDSREDALRNELASVKSEAAARQEARDYEDGAPTKFQFDADVTKKAIMQFVEPFLRDDSTRRFYLQLEVTPST